MLTLREHELKVPVQKNMLTLVVSMAPHDRNKGKRRGATPRGDFMSATSYRFERIQVGRPVRACAIVGKTA